MAKRPYTLGSKLAMAAIKKRYGKNWAHVFYGRANKLGTGKAPHTRANSIFTKGRKQVKRPRKRK